MHTTKFTRGGVANMLRHYDRTANNISNENIDHAKTKENYNLAPTHSEGAREFLVGRIQTATNWEYCNSRKKTNVLCDTVVTLPKDYKGDERAFFKGCYEFLADRYGKENVVSAFVHTDETTPHMHFAFVPICSDGRLSAKDKVNRADLKTLHKDCEKYLATQGIVANLLSENDTSKTNKSIVQLQTATLKELKAVKQAEIDEIEQRVKSYAPPKKTLTDRVFKGTYEEKVKNHEKVALTYNREKDLNEKETKLNKRSSAISSEVDKAYQDGYDEGYEHGKGFGIAHANLLASERENEQIGALQTQIGALQTKLEAFNELDKLIKTDAELNQVYQNALAEQEAERERKRQLNRRKNRGMEH